MAYRKSGAYALPTDLRIIITLKIYYLVSESETKRWRFMCFKTMWPAHQLRQDHDKVHKK